MRIVPAIPKSAKPKPMDRANEARRILHEMLNQLSVINLYSFKIRGSLRRERESPSRADSDLKALEHVVEEIVQLADRLAKEIGACAATRAAHGAARAGKSRRKAGNVLRLFES
jgi:hypothetical protein